MALSMRNCCGASELTWVTHVINVSSFFLGLIQDNRRMKEKSCIPRPACCRAIPTRTGAESVWRSCWRRAHPCHPHSRHSGTAYPYRSGSRFTRHGSSRDRGRRVCRGQFGKCIRTLLPSSSPSETMPRTLSVVPLDWGGCACTSGIIRFDRYAGVFSRIHDDIVPADGVAVWHALAVVGGLDVCPGTVEAIPAQPLVE